jgi:hypothetical protein
MNTINFSLYGTGYEDGLLPNIAAARKLLPGWRINVFHDGCLDLSQGTNDVHLIRVDEPASTGMFWRFLGAEGAECAIFRDIDSVINARDAAATLAWVASGKAVHVMHDHAHHCQLKEGPILGGMWGLRAASLPYDFVDLVRWWIQRKHPFTYGSDMWFLNRYVWPYALRDGLLHLHRHSLVAGDAWPVHEPITGYVGQRLHGPKAGQD